MFAFLKKLFGKKKEEEEFPLSYVSNNVTSTQIKAINDDFENETETVKTPESKRESFNTEVPGEKTQSPDELHLEAFEDKNKKYGFEDENGNVIIKAQFDEWSEFKEGCAAVKLNEKYGLINTKGEYLLAPEYDTIYFPFLYSEGLMQIEKNELWGYANTKGEIVIAPQYDYVNEFKDGMAPVLKEDAYGYINKNNKVVLEFKFSDAGTFCEGLAYASPYDPDLPTDEEMDAKDDDDDSDGPGGSYGYIDKSGNFVIEPQYDSAADFSEGLAPVRMDNKWGFIDKNGKLVIPYQYAWADPFKFGIANIQLEKKGKWGYIDHSGKIVIPVQYDNGSEFMENGTAYVFIDGKCSTIDPTGKKVGD